MKHKKIERIWYSVLGNAIFVLFMWLAWQDFHGVNWFMGIFILVGMIASFLGINYLIELSTRDKDKEN